MKFKALVIAALVALSASTAFAAKSQIGVGAGTTIPIGDLGDAAGIGFHIGGEYDYMASENLAYGGELTYHKLGSKDLSVGTISVDSEFSVIQYTVHGKYFFPAQGDMHPFVKLGAGLYSGKAKVESNVLGASGESTSTDFGINFGGGANWKINDNMGWGVKAAYHYIASDGDAATMITLGAGLNWGMGN